MSNDQGMTKASMLNTSRDRFAVWLFEFPLSFVIRASSLLRRMSVANRTHLINRRWPAITQPEGLQIFEALRLRCSSVADLFGYASSSRLAAALNLLQRITF